MKSERRSIAVLCIYFFVMLFVLVTFVNNLNTQNISYEQLETTNEDKSEVPETKVVYIPIYIESTETSEVSETVEENYTYIVKSYEEKIGIFIDNKLIDVIDVYTKTLPKADQRLLEKGIVVSERAELNALIEDYSG